VTLMTSHELIAARLAAIVDSSFDAIVSKDLNSIIQTWNAAAERLFGYSADEAVGKSILMLIPPNLASEEADIIARIRAGERVESYDTIRRRKDGSLIPVSLTISPIKDAEGRIVGASKIARDISAARDAEQRIRLLLREVNHRVKNQFSVILSIIRETSNRARSPEEFETEVRERIMALSRSHDLLVGSDWAGAGLFELAQEHLSIFGSPEQVNLSGPLVMLMPNAVQNLGMAMHELGTNAAKYGALSGKGGTINVHWTVEHDGDDRDLVIHWEETSQHILSAAGSEVAPRRGFGSVVLERVVPLSLNGAAQLQREDGRLTWTLRVPANEAISPTKTSPGKGDAHPW
jgi:PAS domain S-box-containing protein